MSVMNRIGAASLRGTCKKVMGYLRVLIAGCLCGTYCLHAIGIPTYAIDPEIRSYRDLVLEARKYDPSWADPDDVDIEKVVGMYESVLEEFPNHPYNIWVLNRLGQLHAYLPDVTLESRKAAEEYWRDLISKYPPTQIRHTQALMGIASVGWFSGDRATVLEMYGKTLQMDPAKMEYDWGDDAYLSDDGKPGWDTSSAAQEQLEPYQEAVIYAQERSEELVKKALRSASGTELSRLEQQFSGKAEYAKLSSIITSTHRERTSEDLEQIADPFLDRITLSRIASEPVVESSQRELAVTAGQGKPGEGTSQTEGEANKYLFPAILALIAVGVGSLFVLVLTKTRRARRER